MCGETVEWSLYIKNGMQKIIDIRRIRTNLPWVKVLSWPKKLEPKESAQIKFVAEIPEDLTHSPNLVIIIDSINRILPTLPTSNLNF